LVDDEAWPVEVHPGLHQPLPRGFGFGHGHDAVATAEVSHLGANHPTHRLDLFHGERLLRLVIQIGEKVIRRLGLLFDDEHLLPGVHGVAIHVVKFKNLVTRDAQTSAVHEHV
jgi:hypothetical protein